MLAESAACWLPQHWAHLLPYSDLAQLVSQVVPQVLPQVVRQVLSYVQVMQEGTVSHLSELGHAHETQQMIAEGWYLYTALLLRFDD